MHLYFFFRLHKQNKKNVVLYNRIGTFILCKLINNTKNFINYHKIFLNMYILLNFFFTKLN